MGESATSAKDKSDQENRAGSNNEENLSNNLICLSSWLERATNMERQAHQARIVFSTAALTAGTGLAIALLASGEPRLGVYAMALLAMCATTAFHLYDLDAMIWQKVAVALQSTQHMLISPRHDQTLSNDIESAEQIYERIGPSERIHFFSGRAIVLYLTSMVMVFAITLYDKPKVRQIQPDTVIDQSAPSRPIFKPRSE